MVEYNPFSQEVMRDPHPVYARLREEAPCYCIEEYGAYAYSRFDDIWNASMDAERYSVAKGTTSAHVLTKVQPVTPMLNMMDPPQHTELRAKLREHFIPSRVRKLEPLIRELAMSCLDTVREQGSMDVMGDYSSVIATKVACTINGIPIEDGDMLNGLVQRFFKRVPEIDGMTPDGIKAMEELFAYFMQLIGKRRGESPDEADVVKMFTEVEVAGQKVPDEAIASHLTMLLIGGAETFPKVFANGMQFLAEHPEQRALLAGDASLIPDGFQEIVRYGMPTQFLCRTLTKDHELHGVSMPAGSPVLFLYPSGNRDPREFENPDTFDVQRGAQRLLSFGHGTHLCLGIHVAKTEGRICFEELLKRIPEWDVDLEGSERLVTDFVQGYASLPITFRPF